MLCSIRCPEAPYTCSSRQPGLRLCSPSRHDWPTTLTCSSGQCLRSLLRGRDETVVKLVSYPESRVSTYCRGTKPPTPHAPEEGKPLRMV